MYNFAFERAFPIIPRTEEEIERLRETRAKSF